MRPRPLPPDRRDELEPFERGTRWCHATEAAEASWGRGVGLFVLAILLALGISFVLAAAVNA